LVTDGLLTKEKTDFDFYLNGKRIQGSHTGLLAYRENKFAFATDESELFVDGQKVKLEYI